MPLIEFAVNNSFQRWAPSQTGPRVVPQTGHTLHGAPSQTGLRLAPDDRPHTDTTLDPRQGPNRPQTVPSVGPQTDSRLAPDVAPDTVVPQTGPRLTTEWGLIPDWPQILGTVAPPVVPSPVASPPVVPPIVSPAATPEMVSPRCSDVAASSNWPRRRVRPQPRLVPDSPQTGLSLAPKPQTDSRLGWGFGASWPQTGAPDWP